MNAGAVRYSRPLPGAAHGATWEADYTCDLEGCDWRVCWVSEASADAPPEEIRAAVREHRTEHGQPPLDWMWV